MNIDVIEGLTNDDIKQLYDDIIESDNYRLSTKIYADWYCINYGRNTRFVFYNYYAGCSWRYFTIGQWHTEASSHIDPSHYHCPGGPTNIHWATLACSNA